MNEETSNFFRVYFHRLSVLTAGVNYIDLTNTVQLLKDAEAYGKKVILAGNGGSAAMASHVAVDLTKACGIRAVNFNEADLITCFANDYGYENWVSEALRAYADPGDCVVLISSSGQSKNIINAAIQSKTIGCSLVTLSGF